MRVCLPLLGADNVIPSFPCRFSLLRALPRLANSLPRQQQESLLHSGSRDHAAQPYIPSTRKGAAESASDHLATALRDSAYYNAVPPDRAPSKRDLSLADPAKLDQRDGTSRSNGCNHQRQRLHTVLAAYLRHFRPQHLPRGPSGPAGGLKCIATVFNEEVLKHLRDLGFDVEDVVTWAWIVTAQSSDSAARRLLVACNTRMGSGRPTPVFVLLFILRRRAILPSALRLLVEHTEDRFEKKHNSSWNVNVWKSLDTGGNVSSTVLSDESAGELEAGHVKRKHEKVVSEAVDPPREASKQKIGVRRQSKSAILKFGEQSDVEAVDPSHFYYRVERQTLMVLVVRLVRHARRYNPAVMPSIARLFCAHGIDALVNAYGARASIVTFCCNKILRLLGNPCSIAPFASTIHQQRAQTTIVAKMNSTDPPILISREGFQGIAQVQLGHRKTENERRWDKLKSASWPPWKQDKIGLDARVDIETGTTRAMHALRSQAASGYQQDGWDDAATVLAGWDVDGSPTIQTRRFVPQTAEPATYAQGNLPLQDAEQLWASRVIATRTLNEAWSVFLSYQSTDLPALPIVYNEMLAKMFLDRVRPRNDRMALDEGAVRPGDGLEVQKPPRDPRAAVFTRTSPPDVNKFLETMVQSKIVLRPPVLRLAMRQAQSFTEALAYLSATGLDEKAVRQLTGRGRLEPTTPERHALFHKILAEYIPALLRLSDSRAAAAGEWRALAGRAVPLAFDFLRTWRPDYVPCWSAFVVGVSALRRGWNARSAPLTARAWTANWNLMRACVNHMRRLDLPPDLRIFAALCAQLCKTALQQRVERARAGFAPKQADADARKALEIANKLRMLKNMFGEVTGSGLPTIQHPSTIAKTEDAAHHELPSERSAPTAPSSEHSEENPTADLSTGDGPRPGPPSPEHSAMRRAADDNGPALLQVPHWAHLHAFARALAAGRDAAGLVALLRWARRHAAALDGLAAQSANGARMRRRALVAVRVGLEDEGKEAAAEAAAGAPPRGELRAQAREIVRAVEGWGGWPDEGEVRRYHAVAKQRREDRRADDALEANNP